MTEILRRVKEHNTQGEILDRMNTAKPEHRDRIGTDGDFARRDMDRVLSDMERKGASNQDILDARAAMIRTLADNGYASEFTPPAQDFPDSPKWTDEELEYLATFPHLG